MASGNGLRPFRLSLSEAVRLKIVALQEAASRAGCQMELAAALRVMLDQLSYHPLSWGDRQFDFHAAKLNRYQNTGPFIIVLYGVHLGSRTVFLQDVKPRPGTPLADAAAGE